MKITSHNEEMLRAAVEQFIDKDRKDIEGVAMETLEGHQRAMMGAMTVDEIFKDRIKFSTQVFDIASTDLFNMGIQVISYTLKDIKDEDQYMVSLGKDRIVFFYLVPFFCLNNFSTVYCLQNCSDLTLKFFLKFKAKGRRKLQE